MTDDQFVLPVEEYLFARGAEYAQRYRPESFVCLSESIDLHRVDAARIFAPVTAIAVREDQLVPLGDMRAHGGAAAERRTARDFLACTATTPFSRRTGVSRRSSPTY